MKQKERNRLWIQYWLAPQADAEGTPLARFLLWPADQPSLALRETIRLRRAGLITMAESQRMQILIQAATFELTVLRKAEQPAENKSWLERALESLAEFFLGESGKTNQTN